MIVKIFIYMLLLSIYSCKHVHTHKKDKVINFDELESGKPFLEENKRELRHQLKNITHPFRRRRFGHSAHKKHKDHGYIKKRHINKNKHRKKDDDRDTEFADRVLRSIGDVDSVPHHREHHEHEHDSVEHERMILDRMVKDEAEKKDAERKRNLEEIGRVTGAQVALEPLQDVKDKNMAKHIADQEALAAILGQPTTGDPTLKKVSHDSLHPMTSLEDEIREAFAQGFTREDIMKALGNTGLEMNEVAEAISNVIGKTPPSPSSHAETVEAVGSRTADEVDTMLKIQGVPGPTRKAVAAEAGGVAAQDANKKLTDKKIGQAHQMIEESMIMNKNMQNNLRENEARNEANAQKFRALRQGLPMETAEKLAKQAYDESMSITSNYNPGPDPYVVKDAAEQAANAVESYHQTAGSNPIEAKAAAEETAASIINSAPTPQYEQQAMNASFSHANSPSDEMVEERAAAHGFVPREKLEAERTANQILHEEATVIIGHLNRENQDQAEENAMLKEGIRRLPGAFTRNKPQNRGFEDAEAIENAKAIMNLPPELQEQALGNIKSIPPEATSIEVEHGVMNLPLKAPDDTVPKNEEEAKEMGKMDKLNERLDGTITENKLETNLNTIVSKGGVMNIPKSAEGMEVDEGKVFFKKEAVEKMRREGKDISHFTQVINKGENQDVPNGATYYEANITKGHFALPSTANPNASSVIQTEAGEIDISNGGKVFIKKGRVKKKPTSEFQKYERPAINEDMEAVVVATPEEKKALEETMHAAETLGKGTTIIRESLDGGHNVIYKRPLGPPVTIPLEEMLESIKTGKEGPLQKQLTEEGLEVFQAAGGKSRRMTGETHESLNILDKSTPTGKTREEDIIKRVLNNTGRSETITVVNGFTNKPGRMKRQIVEEIGMVGEEKRYRRPDGVTITETGGVYKVLPKNKKETVTEEGEIRVVNSKPSKTEIVTTTILTNLFTNISHKAQRLGITEIEYITIIKSLPSSIIKDFYNHAVEHTPLPKSSLITIEQLIGRNNIQKFRRIIYEEIGKVTGRGDPDKKLIKRRQIKRLIRIIPGAQGKPSKHIYANPIDKFGELNMGKPIKNGRKMMRIKTKSPPVYYQNNQGSPSNPANQNPQPLYNPTPYGNLPTSQPNNLNNVNARNGIPGRKFLVKMKK